MQAYSRRILRCALLLFCAQLLFAANAFAQQAAQKSFLWEIRGATGKAYLFGTIHVGKPDFFPLSSAIEQSFAQADGLAVEADLTNEIKMEEIVQKAQYEAPDNLEKHVSKETMTSVLAVTSQLNLSREMVVQMRPWLLGSAIVAIDLIKAGYDPTAGVDEYLVRQAKSTNKILVELESVEFQANMMNGLSDHEQEAFLLSTVAPVRQGTSAAILNDTVRAWQTGNPGAMEKVVQASLKNGPMGEVLLEKIVYSRHPAMIDNIDKLLKSGKTYFVAVGALHLVGNKGLVKLLRNKGYTVTQL